MKFVTNGNRKKEPALTAESIRFYRRQRRRTKSPVLRFIHICENGCVLYDEIPSDRDEHQGSIYSGASCDGRLSHHSESVSMDAFMEWRDEMINVLRRYGYEFGNE